jgi:asparagine synthase (glutamine-hydrolysing)
VTCFAGVNNLLPGRYLRLDGGNGSAGTVRERTYWDMDFPDQGEEEHGNPDRLTDGLEAALVKATQRRLQSDVPVVSYLSGGLDSSLIVAMASKLLGRPIPTFSVRVTDPGLDESAHASAMARHVGSQSVMVDFHPATLHRQFQRLIRSAEAPVVDTTCAATMLLAEQVRESGYKVALTGEGADEWLAGYPWYKTHKWLEYLDLLPGLPLSRPFRRAYLWWMKAPTQAMAQVLRAEQAAGAYTAWHDLHALTIMAKLRFLSPEMRAVMQEHEPYDDIGLNRERLRRWHPLNRSLYVGAKILMPGILLSAKGDRAAMSASVETRYPFLDEDVFTFLAGVHPRWKLRGFREKYLLRRVAERWLPPAIAWRPKMIFRGPLEIFHAPGRPAYVDQLLSESALKRAGYFDPQAVALWRQAVWQLRPGSHARTSLELGLTGVLATQLWHHEFFGPELCELPRRQESPVAMALP